MKNNQSSLRECRSCPVQIPEGTGSACHRTFGLSVPQTHGCTADGKDELSLQIPTPVCEGVQLERGLPTLLDRIAQQVAKTHLERILEPHFHNSSFGYRPDRNCHQAIAQANRNTYDHDFVIDMDIKGFFDNIDHDLLMKAVRFYCDDKWILLYVERWLKAGIVQQDSTYIDQLTGTPQGGVISPLLANLFMHVCFDNGWK